MGDFHWVTGDLTREQLNGDPYGCGARVGMSVCEYYYPRFRAERLARRINIHVWSRGQEPLGGARLGDSCLTRDGVLAYGRDSRFFDIFVCSGLDYAAKERTVALLLGLALVSRRRDGCAGDPVHADRVSGAFAQGFADEVLRGVAGHENDGELERAMRLSAAARSRVKAVLFGGDAARTRAGGVNCGGGSPGGAPVLVAGSAGSGRCAVDGRVRSGPVESISVGSGMTVAPHDNVSRLDAHPDSVLSLNGHTVEVYNPDGVPLSTVIDGRGVFLVNESTGERVRVPAHASHVFFVDGDVWFHYPNWGEPDLVFDDGWVERNRFPKCRCCGAPVDVDGEACVACEDNECLNW